MAFQILNGAENFMKKTSLSVILLSFLSAFPAGAGAQDRGPQSSDFTLISGRYINKPYGALERCLGKLPAEKRKGDGETVYSWRAEYSDNKASVYTLFPTDIVRGESGNGTAGGSGNRVAAVNNLMDQITWPDKPWLKEKENNLCELRISTKKGKITGFGYEEKNKGCLPVIELSRCLGAGKITRLSAEELNRTDADGETLLHWAVKKNDAEAVKALLEMKPDLNAADKAGYTPLLIAAENGNEKIVSMLIKAGADVNKATAPDSFFEANDNLSPLQIAAFKKYPSIVEILAKAGADTNGEGPDGFTPLYMAAINGDSDTAKVLLEHKAALPYRYSESQNGYALYPAVKSGDAGTVGLLIKAGADTMYEPGDKALNLLGLAVRNDSLDVAELLLKHMPADANSMRIAVRAGNIKAVKLLLAKMNASDIKKDIAEYTGYAGCSGSDILKLFLPYADINKKDLKGNTALHYAAGKGCAGAVALLLKNGADEGIKNTEGQTALDKAKAAGNSDIAALLSEKGAARGKIVASIEKQDRINILSRDLNYALLEKNYEALKNLIKEGADINKGLADMSDYYSSPRAFEGKFGNVQREPASPESDSGAEMFFYSQPPLLKALYLKDQQAADILIGAGADTDVKDRLTALKPLMLSVMLKLDGTARRLLGAQGLDEIIKQYKAVKTDSRELYREALVNFAERNNLSGIKRLLENGDEKDGKKLNGDEKDKGENEENTGKETDWDDYIKNYHGE